MTDTTNHAEVIRKALNDYTSRDNDGGTPVCTGCGSKIPICLYDCPVQDALTALDALTRELEDAKEDARLWHESEKACSTQFDKLLDENRAQSARIATLEAELAGAQMAERERIIEILIYGQKENVRAFRYDGDQFWAANEVYLRAALAPSKEEQ